MEMKITISDTGAGTVSIQINGESVRTGVESSATGGQQVASSSESLRATGAIGAIDAGRAPTAGGTIQFGAPQPFISGSNVGDVMTSPEIWVAAMPDASDV